MPVCRHPWPEHGVSIRARHCWRANLTGWRFTGTRKSFNPRPPLLAGESGFCDFCAGVRQFQSAPAIAGGRIGARVPAMVRPNGFNPRPPLLAGEWYATRNGRRSAVFQSAPAIAGGRMRRCWGRCSIPPCFNPRPPLLAGEYTRLRRFLEAYEVSIRARHCWRANFLAFMALTKMVVFQSAPAIAGGRIHFDPAVWIKANPFQSAPAIAGGRMAWLVGEGTAAEFQSAPAIAGGRMTNTSEQKAVSPFQSAPAIAGGRISRPACCAGCNCVSIRARHCWRANPSRANLCWSTIFSSTSANVTME